MEELREKCYACYRPVSSCMCGHITPVETKTKFVILMHPKEFKKTKNGTGHLTHLSLPNSEIHIAIDFSDNTRINALINDPKNDCYILYPGKESISLNHRSINQEEKSTIIFIIDSTWACSKKMLRLSTNLHALPRISFDHAKLSRFRIKQQPKEYCLSTIESTHCVLELLNEHGDEMIDESKLSAFLRPFDTMVEYQIKVIESNLNIRYTERPKTPLHHK